ncbi:Ribosomal RNA small subunit methyltransferase G [uncultured Desulfobacterium sp.]|uniref:Ribosomal RNA small subunit methyltransferase G n=1 Tax=uncultured Desulfobacterium sp. TaxID=201089 RepID=A0A445N3I0_9BACT|nr:Ribosomal RNA small subunit methyltransferase G [uncultured Desulfobacterium sp.]
MKIKGYSDLPFLLQSFGVDLSLDQIRLLSVYLDELWDWNRKINLTGLYSKEQIIDDLLVDSLIPSRFLPHEGRLLDLGSGAGMPAIPLKISKPALIMDLVEANSKKVVFLRHVIRLAGLSKISVIQGRIENSHKLLHPEGYHVITARALAHLSQVITWCGPHLIKGGQVVAFLGVDYDQIVKESTDVLARHGLSLVMTIPYILPGKEIKRHILIFDKGKKILP